MVRLFRSFSWTALLPLFAVAVLLRSFAWFAPLADVDRHAHLPGALDGVGAVLAQAPLWRVVLGALVLTLIGLLGTASLQYYRLANAGTLPAFLAVLIGSAAAVWLDLDSGLLAGLAIVGAAHQLYGAYRHQGASLPVFNAGLYVGVAWLLAAPFVYFAAWALLVLPQLRNLRGADLLGLLIGILAAPVLFLMYAFVFGDFAAAWTALFEGAFALPTLGGLRQNIAPLAVLAGASLLALLSYGALSTRRPVQEQRAHRMYFTMLGVGWVALLLSGGAPAYSPAFLLPSLSILLGVALLERGGKAVNVLLIAGTVAVVGAHVYLCVRP